MEVVKNALADLIRHGAEARVLPRKAVGEWSRGAGTGSHAGRKQAGDSEDPRESRRCGIDEGGRPVNFTLELCSGSAPKPTSSATERPFRR
jgi:hypothetical protein